MAEKRVFTCYGYDLLPDHFCLSTAIILDDYYLCASCIVSVVENRLENMEAYYKFKDIRKELWKFIKELRESGVDEYSPDCRYHEIDMDVEDFLKKLIERVPKTFYLQ